MTASVKSNLAAALAAMACACAVGASTEGLEAGHLPLEEIELITMPGPNLGLLVAQDELRADQGLPLRFAVPNPVSMTPSTHGTWETLDDTQMMWRLRVLSEGAWHLNFGFGRLALPRSAALTIYSVDGLDVTNTLTAADNPLSGAWWSRIVRGEEVVIEVSVDASERNALLDGIEITSINEGYRGLGAPPTRGASESCNIDVSCPEGDPWEDEIPSVALYTINGSLVCSGVMLNNTAQDQTPYFLTADHCGINNGNDQSVVIYWNHENSSCRTPGSPDSGGNGDGQWNQYTSGSMFLVGSGSTDYTLVRLNSSPNATWGVTFSGWSRSTSTPSLGSSIHHPEGAEKRISFPDTVYATGGGGMSLWGVNWDEGRTAPGSSGAPLYNADHQVVGQLCCGTSYCWNDDDDYYGRSISGSWSQLDAYLDPLGTNPMSVNTLVPGGGDPQGACCVAESCTYGTEHDCMVLGGEYQGDGTTCIGDPCNPWNGDTCEQAQTASEGSNFFDTTSASDSGYGDPDESQCSGTYLDWDNSPDHWFTWIAPGDGTLDLDTCNTSSYDTSMVLYQGVSCANLAQIACNGDADDDTGCQQYHSQISGTPVTSGQGYYVRLGGWQGATGAGTLNLAFTGDPDPQGACCIGQACTVVNESYCTAVGGTWLGDGTDCANEPCTGDPTGACCIGTSCSVLTEVECALADGDYGGDGSSCSPTSCQSTVAISWRITGIDRTSLDQPHFTVDVYLEVPDGHRLDAVAGNANQQKMIVTTGSFFQNTAYGGPMSTDVNPAFYELVPDLEWDSRVTIGCLDSTGAPWSENTLGSVGIDWSDFESGGALDIDNGTFYVLPSAEQGTSLTYVGEDCEQRNGILIARLTTMGMESEILVEALFQGRDDDDSTWQQTASGLITWQGEQDCNLNEVPDACDIANGTSDDDNGNGIPDECDNACPGDADGDGDADVDDILRVIASYGTDTGGDVDGDGDTDVDDLLQVIAYFGIC